MIKMNVRMNFNAGALTKRAQMAKEKAQMELDQQIIKDSNFYAPQDEGNLQNSAIRHSTSGRIVWVTPYAKRLYYNPQYNFSKDRNPNAGGLWYEQAKSAKKEQWVQLAEDAYKRGLKN